MAKKQTVGKPQNSVSKQQLKLKKGVNNALADIYVIAMFTVFPLFLTNYYQSARRDKFWLFVVLTGIIGVSVGFVALSHYFSTQKRNFYRDPFSLNLTDIGLLAFLGVTLISTILAVIVSANPSEEFINLWLGSYGRNMGLLMIIALAVCYFVISRFYFYQKYVFYLMFIGMTIMSLIAILNFYYIDILGIFKAYGNNENVNMNFTTTIGNKNYLSAMICVALPFSAGTAIASEDKILRIVSYISTSVQFMGLLVATSDGGFLGCMIAFAVILIVASKNLIYTSRFFFCLCIMMTSAKLLWLFDLAMNGHNKEYTSFSGLFVYYPGIFALIPVFFALAAVYAKLCKPIAAKVTFITSIALAATCALAIIALFIYFTSVNPKAEVNSFTKFFRFNEAWGTHRGYFWIHSFDVFGSYNFIEMLFGTGPDTFYNSFEPFFEGLKKFGDDSSNAAHNVYINYLVTQGIFGVGTYLLFAASAIKNAVKNAFSNPLSLVCMCVIVSYAAQDIVNIANPVNTPWFIIFIALSESVRLKANNTDRLTAFRF